MSNRKLAGYGALASLPWVMVQVFDLSTIYATTNPRVLLLVLIASSFLGVLFGGLGAGMIVLGTVIMVGAATNWSYP
jgi:hypothetical protein